MAVYIDRNGVWKVPKHWNDLSAYRNDISGKQCRAKSNEGRLQIGRLGRSVKIDIAVLCCHGGEGENGTLQAILENAKIPYTCSGISASAVGLNKVLAKQIFKSAGLNVVEYTQISHSEYENNLKGLIEKLKAEIGYPMIVKPTSMGSSIGVSKVANDKELISALSVAFEWDNNIIVERALKNFYELNCAVLKDKDEIIASEVEKPTSLDEILSYADKYERGGLTCKGGREFPASISSELSEKIKQNALIAYESIGASGIARIDFLVEGDDVYVNEINTIPGSLALYLFENESETLQKIIEQGKLEHKNRKRINSTYASGIIKGKNGQGA